MDRAALERRLAGRAELVLGDVVQTLTEWRPAPDAPLGAVLFDLDLYTSTKAGLRILLNENVLPRVWCYFDDVEGYPINAFGDGAGERAALAEFNAASQRSELQDYISPARVFKNMTPEAWQRRIYIYHRFSHPQYNANISGQAKHELRLSGG